MNTPAEDHTKDLLPKVTRSLDAYLAEGIESRPLQSPEEFEEMVAWYVANCPRCQADDLHQDINRYEIERNRKNIQLNSYRVIAHLPPNTPLPHHIKSTMLRVCLWIKDDSERMLFKLTWG